MHMLRSLRKSLRQIRYYSATPTRNRWTRAMDIALFTSLALAVPAALLSDVLFVRVVPSWHQHGRMTRGDGGRIEAALIDADQVNMPWDQSRPYGTFVLSAPQRDSGLPFVSSRHPLPLTVELDLFTEPNLDAATALTPGAAVHGAIDSIVRRHGGTLLRTWEGELASARRYWGPMAMNVVVWWFAIYAVSTIGILLARAGTTLFHHQQTARKRYWQQIGRCARCGYDMRGLEFSSRCPECGELV